ncbi:MULTISPECIES: hypothetical protein [Methanobacterium]|uniref:Uncharacterized protein n=1 Tax=Methanobacterium bryantii TaxID=2161 RepID=A0A2A2H2W3_METBR|nr:MULTISPECIES: hypothetical protein [Methanobacterium]OEC87657.1 hypothetical protein A9507_00140 [Methanobacterium sp. A39]PAV03707.1 hypothetical protein ASJ80_01710 [Methanobacterium bryantii]
MKPEKTSLVKIGYNKEKNKYFATFRVLDLDEKEIGRIIRHVERPEGPKNRKIYINDCKVYVTDFFEAELFESRYPHIVKFARDGVVLERVDASVLDVEADLCMMEQDVDFSVKKRLI